MWPFWLLLAAWFCANIPQGVSYVTAVWVGEGRTFSHQQRLETEVAKLLDGEETSPLFASVPDGPAAPGNTAIPVEQSLKKFELALESEPDALTATSSVVVLIDAPRDACGLGRAAPPVEPPRVLTIV
ncbi:MAG: hypothetical protein ABIV50_00870 [Opitutus sp.]